MASDSFARPMANTHSTIAEPAITVRRAVTDRSQSDSRKSIDFLELKDGRWKLHPIADWSDYDVWKYLQAHDLPYHPLWHEGYVSIGDVHTTRRLQDGMSEEDTRFFGLKRECGLHEDWDSEPLAKSA